MGLHTYAVTPEPLLLQLVSKYNVQANIITKCFASISPPVEATIDVSIHSASLGLWIEDDDIVKVSHLIVPSMSYIGISYGLPVILV